MSKYFIPFIVNAVAAALCLAITGVTAHPSFGYGAALVNVLCCGWWLVLLSREPTP